MKKAKSTVLLRLVIFFLSLNSGFTFSQDTLRVLQYNLLHYGVSDGGCTMTPTATKNIYLKDIIGAVQPDVWGVNEMGTNNLYAENILINVLRTFNSNWEHCTYTNQASSNLTNMFFYRGDKLALYNEHVIPHSLRDINLYTFYYRDPNLATSLDTAFVTFVVVHLKAGSTAQDAIDRADQANVIMNYLDGLGKPGNYFVQGDFNLQTSSEQAYSNFTTDPNSLIKMNDPINMPGSWNSNSSFQAIHTQSTRTGSLPDCGASGGMDDRFDFILCNNYVMGDSAKVKYIPGSYKAFGQDGAHYNGNINGAPTNSVVSAAVANSLYNNSDHLPVTLLLKFDVTPAAAINPGSDLIHVDIFPNPFNDEVQIHVPEGLSGKLFVRDLLGREIHSQTMKGESVFGLFTRDWTPGLYFLEIQGNRGETLTKKLIKW